MRAPQEWWVLRVIDPQAELTPMMLADLECVSGELCEPIECCGSEEAAIERAMVEHQRTGKIHKVVLSLAI